MIRKFQCLDCKHQFQSDDSGEVACTKCQSDNVKPITSNRTLYIMVAAVVCFMIGFGVTEIVELNKDKDIIVVNPDEPQNKEITQRGDSMVIPDKKIEFVGTPYAPKYDKSSQKYSVEVSAKSESGNVIYYLTDQFDGSKIIATSEDGKFDNIAPVEKNGTYGLSAVDKNNSNLKVDTHINGFNVVKKVINKLSEETLQKYLSTDKDAFPEVIPDNIASKIKTDAKVALVGADPNKEIRLVEDIDDITEKLKFEQWASVTVLGLDYDENGYVEKITIQVHYPNTDAEKEKNI